MALKKCKDCGQEVSKKAKTCPNCGAPLGPKQFSVGKLIVLILFGTFMYALFTSDHTPTTSRNNATVTKVTSKTHLPQHSVASNTSLAPKDGRRIEIHVSNVNLTKDECRTLNNAYRNDAGTEGQVSVQKPDKSGELWPWCVDNIDGKGVFFNDFYFDGS